MIKESYIKLGEFIEQCNERNINEYYGADELRGINNEGNVMPSKANIIGVSFHTYKIAHKGYFIYNPARLDIGSISCLQEEVAIFSQMYVIFKIKEKCKNTLLTEYLWMWFKRKEFFRYVAFVNFGSVREMFTYEDMCNVMLPVPPIEEQRRIVSEYQTVERRIANNEALIQKLEETAQAIYHHTFVEGIDEENLPEGWNVTDVEHFCIETKSGGTPSRTNDSYWNKKDIPWLKSGEVQNCFVFDTEEYISKEGMECSSAKLIPKDSVVMAMYGATASQVCYLKNEMTTNQAYCNMICDSKSKACFLYFHLKAIQSDIKKLANGGAQENLNKELVVSQRIICAPNDCYLPFLKIGNYISNISEENIHLRTLLSLLTSKLS